LRFPLRRNAAAARVRRQLGSRPGFATSAYQVTLSTSGSRGAILWYQLRTPAKGGLDDFNGDNFDHRNLGFIGGADIGQSITGGRPVQFHPVPKGTPAFGSAWKKAVAHWYNRAFGMNAQGGVQAYRGNYLDLDPTYRDVYGQPLTRMTFDWGYNEYAQSRYMAGVLAKIAKQLGASSSIIRPVNKSYSVVPYQSTHNTGGTVMGSDPATSVVNTYGQSWDVSNLFVTGAGLFPQNAGYNPTGTVGSLAYRMTDAVVRRYLRSPGHLA
jgi:gluconate 2-dehydrogenase alpha chain